MQEYFCSFTAGSTVLHSEVLVVSGTFNSEMQEENRYFVLPEHGNTTVNSIRGQRCPWVEMVSLKLSDLYDSMVMADSAFSDIYNDGQCRVRVPST
jgi:hypothetical protein